MKDKIKAIAQQLMALCGDDCDEAEEASEGEGTKTVEGTTDGSDDNGGAQVTDMGDTFKQEMGGSKTPDEKKKKSMALMSAMLGAKLSSK